MHINTSGMTPWLEDWKYWTRDWHYKFYMGPKAKIAIKSDQEDISKLQFTYDHKARLETISNR